MARQDEVVFVNQVISRGLSNNVANIAFSTFLFLPMQNEKGEVIVTESPVPSVHLRMDIVCLRQLHAELGGLLAFYDDSLRKQQEQLAKLARGKDDDDDEEAEEKKPEVVN